MADVGRFANCAKTFCNFIANCDANASGNCIRCLGLAESRRLPVQICATLFTTWRLPFHPHVLEKTDVQAFAH